MMFWWLRELLSSLRFIAIHSGESVWKSKRVYEFLLPCAVTALFATTYALAPSAFVRGFAGIIAQNTFQFMVFVVPFHLAALGAFATFQRPVLDEPLRGASAEIRVWSNEDQEHQWKSLTLRQYVSLLFGYLCSIGVIFICVYIIGGIVDLAALTGHRISQAAMSLALVFFISHYAFLSIYAITFLFEKVNGIGRTHR